MNILITGKGSYIGAHIKECLENNNHKVYELDMLTDEWKVFDYSPFDAVVHVAAIVHQNAKKSSWDTFYRVNAVLPYEVAKKAKNAGVKQFVFFSSMAVYGQDKMLPKGNEVGINTPLKPVSMYGKSKFQAEKMLEELCNDNFCVAFVRPPNVYGKGCPGNYIETFKKITAKLPVFPYAFNDSRQSFIHINNLANLIRLIVENNQGGIFTPQDDFIPSTNDLIKIISEITGSKIHFTKFLGICIKPFRFISVVNKLYGGVSYDYAISDSFDYKYQTVSFMDGMKQTFEE